MSPEQESWEEQGRSGSSYYYDFVCAYELFSLRLDIFHKLFSSHLRNICQLSVWLLYMNRTIYLITSHFFVFYMEILLVRMCKQFLISPLKSGLLELLFFLLLYVLVYGSSMVLTFISFPRELSFFVSELSHSSLMLHFNISVPENSLMFNSHRWKVKFNVSMDSNIYWTDNLMCFIFDSSPDLRNFKVQIFLSIEISS